MANKRLAVLGSFITAAAFAGSAIGVFLFDISSSDALHCQGYNPESEHHLEVNARRHFAYLQETDTEGNPVIRCYLAINQYAIGTNQSPIFGSCSSAGQEKTAWSPITAIQPRSIPNRVTFSWDHKDGRKQISMQLSPESETMTIGDGKKRDLGNSILDCQLKPIDRPTR